jgi:hypothetical protein
MTGSLANPLDEFQWEPQPRAFAFVKAIMIEFLAENAFAMTLSEKMKYQAGTRFIDWIDFIKLPKTQANEARLLDVGFIRTPQPGAPDCYQNDKGVFPAVILENGAKMTIGIKVDSIADFLACWKISTDNAISGEPGSQFRAALVCAAPRGDLWVVERHGYRGFEPAGNTAEQILKAHRHLETLRRRPRDFQDDFEGYAANNALLDRAIADLGRDWTCDLFFACEREFWQRRNHAAQIQKARQDRLGLGWANHDHHTYRSSRHCFSNLIAVFEKLGFHCRERFYQGHAASGWGAQVIEQPVAGIIIFADVDMTPEELLGDFAHDGFDGGKLDLGTVGLWCALHGEAFLQAGMHHLECVFDWYALKDQLATEAHIQTMDPFTTFPYLRQAFTAGEPWIIDPRRIDAVLERGQITREQAVEFRNHGAIGSHLENLERNDGFKGFNQTGVSKIIAKTDPRRLVKNLAGAGV